MEENKELIKYYATFGELPPILKMLSYDSDIYKAMMEYATITNKKLESDDFKNIVYDIEDTEQEFDDNDDFEGWKD